MSKRLGGNIGCNDRTSSWHSIGLYSPTVVVVTKGQQHHVGEKPTVILYTYINRHAGKPSKIKAIITDCLIGAILSKIVRRTYV